MESGKGYDIYLSYNESDLQVVKLLVEKLRRHDLNVFWAESLAPGKPWREALEEALSRSQAVAVLIGPSGLGAAQQEEVETALMRSSDERRIFPVILPGGSPAQLPPLLKGVVRVDFRDGLDDENAWNFLLEGIRGFQLFGLSPSSSGSASEGSPFVHLSPRARNAILRADAFRRSRRAGRLHMEHLLVGLFDEADAPVKQAFERAKIDRTQLIEILRKAKLSLPSSEKPFNPSNATLMPPLSGHSEMLLAKASDLAEAKGAATIETTDLLQGFFSVTECEVVVAFSALGLQEGSALPEAAGPSMLEVSIRIASTGDQPVDEDSLGFEPYVEAVAEFLVNEETRPPLTLSIEGEWGTGKSSFMRQLEKALRKRRLALRPWLRSLPGRLETAWGRSKKDRWMRLRRELQPPCCLTIRFNAWRHDKEDALWAAFASEFLRRIAGQRAFPRRWLGHVFLFLGRYRWRDGWLEMLRALATWVFFIFLGIVVPVAATLTWPGWTSRIADELQRLGTQKKIEQTTKPGEGSEAPPLFTWLVGFGSLGAYTAGVISLALKAKGVIGNPLDVNLRKYLQSPDYDGHVAFIESFHEDFRRIVVSYAGKRKVYVFIDDLDRCEVPKAADLMQALNLLITDDPQLIFIIGMDREKVAAGLAVKYEKLLPYLMPDELDEKGKIDPRQALEYGYTFIEKFVQLPFRVPRPKPVNLKWFLSTLSGHEPDDIRPLTQPDFPAKPKEASLKEEELPAALQGNSTPVPGIASLSPVGAGQQAVRRELLKLNLRTDSEAVVEAALMVAPALDNNPRRMKQFVNLFRLRAYIASETGAFDEVEGRVLTLQQLGKFVAITLAWPGLLNDLVDHPDLLSGLQEIVLQHRTISQSNSIESRWTRLPSLMALLRYGTNGSALPTPHDPYNLAHADLDRLLRVSPKVTRTPLAIPPSQRVQVFKDINLP